MDDFTQSLTTPEGWLFFGTYVIIVILVMLLWDAIKRSRKKK